ncbi:unnamed protein product [Urochloa humidicola]
MLHGVSSRATAMMKPGSPGFRSMTASASASASSCPHITSFTAPPPLQAQIMGGNDCSTRTALVQLAFFKRGVNLTELNALHHI